MQQDDEWGRKVTVDEENDYVSVDKHLWIRVKEFAICVVVTETGIRVAAYEAADFEDPVSSMDVYYS